MKKIIVNVLISKLPLFSIENIFIYCSPLWLLHEDSFYYHDDAKQYVFAVSIFVIWSADAALNGCGARKICASS